MKISFRIGAVCYFLLTLAVVGQANLLNTIPGLRASYREAFSRWPSLDVAAIDAKGRPSLVRGGLGSIGDPDTSVAADALAAVLNRYLAPFGLTISDFRETRVMKDDFGYRYIHYIQIVKGEALLGSSLSVKISAKGEIGYISSNLTDEHEQFFPVPMIAPSAARTVALTTPNAGEVVDLPQAPSLRLDSATGDIRYAFAVVVGQSGGIARNTVHVDAKTGKILSVVSDIVNAKGLDLSSPKIGDNPDAPRLLLRYALEAELSVEYTGVLGAAERLMWERDADPKNRLPATDRVKLSIPRATLQHIGLYQAVVVSDQGERRGGFFRIDANSPNRASNLSTRVEVAPGMAPFIVGFVVGGESQLKSFLVRAIGPGLAPFGVSERGSLAEVVLYGADGKVVERFQPKTTVSSVELINVRGAAVGAFPAVLGDIANVHIVAPGAYTLHLVPGDAKGTVLLELYWDI